MVYSVQFDAQLLCKLLRKARELHPRCGQVPGLTVYTAVHMQDLVLSNSNITSPHSLSRSVFCAQRALILHHLHGIELYTACSDTPSPAWY